MRIVSLSVVVVAGMGVKVASGSCAAYGITDTWYDEMNKCAHGGYSAAQCISNSIFTLTSIQSANTASADCFTKCIANYVDVLKMNLPLNNDALKSICGGSGTWSGANSPPMFRKGTCLRAIKSYIDDFNTCAATGVDVVTGLANGRCSAADALALNLDQEPYYAVLNGKGTGNQVTSFSGRCGLCATRFATAVNAASTPVGCLYSAPFFGLCTKGFSNQLLSFVTCTGGWALYGTGRAKQCSAEYKTAEAYFAPFGDVFACSKLAMAEREACLAANNRFFEFQWGSTGECRSCATDLVSSANTDCAASVDAAACATKLDTGVGALFRYAVCSGQPLTLADTECSAAQTTPLLPAVVGAVIQQSGAAFNPLVIPAATGKPCEACYRGLALELHERFKLDSTTLGICTNTPGLCVLRIDQELARFEACAGFSVTACTSADLVGKAEAVFDAMKDQTTAAAFDASLASSTLPCAPCLSAAALTLAGQLAWLNACTGGTFTFSEFHTAPPPPSGGSSGGYIRTTTTSTTTTTTTTATQTLAASGAVAYSLILAVFALSVF